MSVDSAKPDPAATALLLIGHGTRFEAGRAEFLETVERVRQRLPATPVEPAFLELCEPDISTAVAKLASAGVTRMVAQPVLLLAAGHALRDIPAALDEAARRHAGLVYHQALHLGCHPALVALSAQRFQEALDDSPPEAHPDDRRVGWIMVGRGSSDASALAEMRRFVDLRLRQTPVAWAETCFLAVARPHLAEALERLAGTDATHVVVQPHLLFQGDLMRKLRDAVDDVQCRHPDKRWRLAAHLGPSPQLVKAIIARDEEARQALR